MRKIIFFLALILAMPLVSAISFTGNDINGTLDIGQFTFNATGDNLDIRGHNPIAAANYTGDGIDSRFGLLGETDLASPDITLVSPPQNFKDTDGNITFEYNVTLISSTIDSCSLYTDSVIDQTDKTITLNINQSFSKVYGEDDAHTWQVRCNNTNGDIGLSVIRDFSIGITTGGEADESNRGGGAGGAVTCPIGTISSNGVCVPITETVIVSIQEIAVDTKDVIGKTVEILEESGERITEAIKIKSFEVLKIIDYALIGTMILLIWQFIKITSKKAKKRKMLNV